MAEPKDEWCAVYTPPNEFGWRSLRNRVDIDSLPPTDERVGMPSVGDRMQCDRCAATFVIEQLPAEMVAEDHELAVACSFCRRCSYDITGHGVASLRGVKG